MFKENSKYNTLTNLIHLTNPFILKIFYRYFNIKENINRIKINEKPQKNQQKHIH